MHLSRSDIIARVEERLAGAIGPEALAAWAFELFYAIEQGEHELDPPDEEPILAALDDLMFADEADFALDEADLRQLLVRLKQP